MFPGDQTSVLRAGDNLMKIGRAEEAVVYFERGLGLLRSPEQSLPLVNRLAEAYAKKLGRPEDAIRVLGAFVERFPGAEHTEAVQRRLERLRSQREKA